MRTRRWSKAFTLVEILIVVVILGILAAIVIPQFTRASEDAQVGNVETQLQTIRSQLELYRVRNNGQPPSLGSGANSGWNDLVSDQFLRTAPLNPRTGTATIVAGTQADSQVPATSGGTGWIYDASTRTVYCVGFNETFRTTTPPGDPWYR